MVYGIRTPWKEEEMKPTAYVPEAPLDHLERNRDQVYASAILQHWLERELTPTRRLR
jgi:hypothetical protein